MAELSLRDLMDRAGLGVVDVQRATRKSRHAVYHWIHGEKTPRRQVYHPLADALGVDLDAVHAALTESKRRRDAGTPDK